MDQTITISVSESLHHALAEQAARLGKTVEELARESLMQRFAAETGGNAPRAEPDPMIAVLRDQGLLTTSPMATTPSDLPPSGGVEERRLLEQLGREASAAFKRTGRTLDDVVER